LLHAIDDILPHRCRIVLLADRVHTGEPLLACQDKLELVVVGYVVHSPHVIG
jgi:hypothetical protein